MTPVEELLEAARQLRSRAQAVIAAQGDRWFTPEELTGLLDGEHRPIGAAGVIADYMASMTPQAALQLADLLEDIAALLDAGWDDNLPAVIGAQQFARAYLAGGQ